MAADRSCSTRVIVPLASPWAAMRASSQWASTSTMAEPTVTTSSVGVAGASMYRTLPPRPLRRDLVLALVEGGDEVVVGAGEGVDALALDGQREVVVVDAGGGEAVDHGPGAVDVALHRVGLGVAMVVQRLDRGGGQRV